MTIGSRTLHPSFFSYKMSPLLIQNKSSLIDYLHQGHSVKYLFFWGHRPSNDGIANHRCFSQWFEAGFLVDDFYSPTAEHYMMAEKARLFGDQRICDQILNAKHPGEAKKLGRLVTGFEQKLWEEKRFEIVVQGNLAKFSQNRALKDY